ncbi:MAG: hypothetical protein ACLFVT_07070, partial [Syntrophobacteria bacterium]
MLEINSHIDPPAAADPVGDGHGRSVQQGPITAGYEAAEVLDLQGQGVVTGHGVNAGTLSPLTLGLLQSRRLDPIG